MNHADAVARHLARRRALVLDGAMATELERRGFDLRDELWSAKLLIERPDAIRAVHASYFEAGADVATTASYQATFEGFARRGIAAQRATELLELAVQLAREARDAAWGDAPQRGDRERPLVAASIGSYGAHLADGSEYRGDYGLDQDALVRFHRPRMQVLAAAGADVLALETVPCRVEALALARLLREFPGARAWLAFSCRDERRTCHGELLADCVRELETNEQIVAIGVNCSAPRFVPALVREVASATCKPIVAYPNSGERYDVARREWCAAAAKGELDARLREAYAAGARILGGCCRTTPDDIRALAQWAHERV